MSARQARRRSDKAPNTPTSLNEEVREGAGDSVHQATEDSEDSNPASENVFLFWPNVICYCRIILAIASLYYMPVHPRTCSLLYSISYLLDALDGYAARAFQQSTRFGAVLDMVIDRCTTSFLLVFLSLAFPRWAMVFQILIALDFSSHYMHMYATLVVSGADSSHKNVDKTQSWLLNLYYSNKNVLFIFCALNELFFIALYLLSFSSPLPSPHLIKNLKETSGGPVQLSSVINASFLRQIFPDPFSAGALEIARANKIDSFWPWVMVRISFPIMAAKQFINVIQLVKASEWLADVDIKLRETKGLTKKSRAKRG